MANTSHVVLKHEPRSPQPVRSRRRATLLDQTVLGLSILNLLAVLTLLILLCIVSEGWWFSLALSYLPRLPYVIPALLLAAAAWLLRRKWTLRLNLLAALLVLGPIMGFRWPLAWLVGSGSDESITVVSYNIQRGGNDLELIVAELVRAQPDVIVLQEAACDVTPVRNAFPDWHVVHSGEYLVAARWPVRMQDACRTRGFGRATAIRCKVARPDAPFLVGNVHLTTARYGLSQLHVDSPFTGRGVKPLMSRQQNRIRESSQTHDFMADQDPDLPLIVAGDFNMPTSSSLYQQHWSGLTSAFDAAGLGYGYTSPCEDHSLWPANTPWLRIDHILASSHWDVRRCWVGRSDGSDHRCIVARLAPRSGR